MAYSRQLSFSRQFALVAGELLCLNGQFILDVCTGGVQLDVGTLSNALGNLNATLSVTLGKQPLTELGS